MVDNLDARLKDAFPKLEVVPALDIARDLGNLRVVNVVMTGALSVHLGIPEDAWLRAIRDSVKERFVDMNLKAFEAGRAI
jgi:indolepyruvate ferredoxin oxidoreductase beta subunit